MAQEHGRTVARQLAEAIGVLGGLALLVIIAACCPSAPSVAASDATLRIGVGALPQQAPEAGLRQVIGTLSLESLVVPSDDGRMHTLLADSIASAPDGLSTTIRLRRSATFDDGTPVTAPSVAQSLKKSLPVLMGPAFDDVKQITTSGSNEVRIDLRQPSRYVIEALETSIQAPNKRGVGTGAYVASTANGPAELDAYPNYYRGRPAIDRITIKSYPSVRTAWAALLRNDVDMLYDVNTDALDSLQGARNVAVFSYLRHYQYMIIFGPGSRQLQQADVRRELNAAVDREALVRVALNGHGIASTGPVPPAHWALDVAAPKFAFERRLAGNLAGRHLRFTCLVPSDSAYERIALAVKQQLAAASVDMDLEEASQEQILEATRTNKYDAVLLDPISGPTLFRSYRAFYSKVPFNPKPRPSALIDAALDQIGHASSDQEYRAGVSAFQKAVIDDPPALFLAWGERARAVSRRFIVTLPESGGDILNTLRLWRLADMQQFASRN